MPPPDQTPGTGTTTTLLLVRHGATAHTAQRRHSGSTGDDPPLSRVGEQQASAVAARLAAQARPVSEVVSSPVLRARQTAASVADALGLEVVLDDDVREIDFGTWEGLTAAQVDQRDPGALARWRSDPHLPAPGGESVAQVAQRVAAAEQRLLRRCAGGTVVVVSHLYPVRLWALAVLDAPPVAVHRLAHGPTSVTQVRVGADGSRALVRYDDDAHLR